MTMGSFLVFVLAALAFLCLWGFPNSSSARSRTFALRKTSQSHHVFAAGTDLVPGAGGGGTSSDMPGGVTSVPLLLELLGTALDSGLTIQGALRAVADVCDPGIKASLRRVVAGLEIGASWQNSWEGNLVRTEVAQLHDALSFGAVTGASVAPLLYAEAQRCRTAASRVAQKRAAALGVKLVLPLGLCSLPAFIALGIVPVVMAMIPQF
jgi:hypothetical protein